MQTQSHQDRSDGPSITQWSDEHLIVINKPAGLLSIPDGYNPDLPHLRSLLEPNYGRLWIVHRLDRQTSGLMILARSAEAHRALNIQFEQSSITKHYHAVVDGCPTWRKKSIELPLRIDGDRKHRTIIDLKKGKYARTDVELLHEGHQYTLIVARPYTGRTHQIRAHLSAVGHPILGDILYGSRIDPLVISRMALHAGYISFTHPLTSEMLSFRVDDPPEFSALFKNDPNLPS